MEDRTEVRDRTEDGTEARDRTEVRDRTEDGTEVRDRMEVRDRTEDIEQRIEQRMDRGKR
mgnify:CR=1 FL=1